MKEETNDNTNRPSEAEVNDMYKNAWLDFQADAQEAKQGLNRRYAIMLETFGTYKDMPYGVKEIVKQDYASHKAKWGDNGEEMQKRFGAKEPTNTEEQEKEFEYKSLADEKDEFLKKLQETRQKTQTHSMEYER